MPRYPEKAADMLVPMADALDAIAAHLQPMHIDDRITFLASATRACVERWKDKASAPAIALTIVFLDSALSALRQRQ